MGSDELMISSIRPFSSDRFFLFDLESLNENCGAGESKDTHPYIYIYIYMYWAQGPNRGRGHVRGQTHGIIEAHSCRRKRQC